MVNPNPKYPRPDTSEMKPQRNQKAAYFPEVDIQQGEIVLPDGRSGFVEDWYDVETEVELRTFYYSTKDSESWSEARHVEYLQETDWLKGYNETYTGCATRKFTDPSGNEMWAVTVPKNPQK